MRLVAAAVVIALALLTARPAAAQENAYRFEITSVGDSTFTFAAGTHGWLKPGLDGIAVDPLRRDALVARFRILRVAGGTATALITGQTTRVTSTNVALVTHPTAPFFKRREFWFGTVLGAALGAVIASH